MLNLSNIIARPALITVLAILLIAFPAFAQVAEIGPGTCVEFCTSETEFDAVNSLVPSDYALTLPGLGDFYFRHPGQFMEEIGNDAAQFVGEIYSTTDPDKGFYLDIKFFGKLTFFDVGFPPPGHPVQNLVPSAYFTGGGNIFPMSWNYYTGAVGVMYGLLDYSGAAIFVTNNSTSLQMGEGASNKTTDLGASANMDFFTAMSPTTGPAFPAFMNGEFAVTMGPTCASLGRLSRPGTGDDFRLLTSTMGSPLSGGIGNDVKLSLTNDTAGILIDSPLGTFNGLPIALGVNCYVECSAAPPTASGFPDVFINSNFGGFLAFGPGGIHTAPIFLPASGFTYFADIAPGHSGANFILQAFVVSPLAKNGIYASSNAHTIKVF